MSYHAPSMSQQSDTRRHIMHAAAQQCALHPDAVQMTDFAAAAGVGRATLYRYFATRDDLIRALADVATEELEAAVLGARLGDVPVREGIERVVRICVTHMFTHGYLLFERAAAPDEEALKNSPTHQMLLELFTRARDEQVLRTDAPLDWLMTSLFGICATAVRSQVQDSAELDHAAWLATSLYLQGAAVQLSTDRSY